MEWIMEIGKQVPGLLVMGWIVMQFLKYMTKCDDRQAKRYEARDDIIRKMGEDSHEVQRDSNNAINENTRALGMVKEVLERINGKK